MPRNKIEQAAALDYFTQMPKTHPEGTVEVRHAQPGEVGYQLGAQAVTATNAAVKLRHNTVIGATERRVYPTTLGRPDVYADGRHVR